MNLTVSSQVEAIFAHCFEKSQQTRLVGGWDEPEYLCRKTTSAHQGENALAEIRYRADYVASAFHEVAHWCIAGRERRQLDDFGYWYAADGRDAAQQQQFCAVEARPQAIESFFHAAWGSTFNPSFDNLDGEAIDGAPFLAAIGREQGLIREHGLPPRAQVFAAALADWERSPVCRLGL